jgi:hypothetical protein
MAKSKIRKKVEKKVFGKCGTCGKTNTPGHTCKMKFSETNAARLKKRMDNR